MNEVPFNITKHEEEKLNTDFARFQELYKKYDGNIEEILEFAKLYEKFVTKKNSKWR